MKKTGKKWLSVVLSAALIAANMGMAIYADPGETVTAGGRWSSVGEDGTCEHHPKHTAECGYVKADPGQSVCRHVHTAECYEDIADPATPGNASPSNADSASKRVLNCHHVHDADCGYIPAVEGHPCTYYCKECHGITYMDANGKTIPINMTRVKELTDKGIEKITGNSELEYYFVENDLSLTNRLVIESGNIVLILGKDAKLTAPRGITVGSGATLTIYGQTETAGTLIATSNSDQAALGGNETSGAGKIVINSGTVKATVNSRSSGDAQRLGAPAAIGGNNSNATAVIEINGGVVEARGADAGPGIGGNWSDGGSIRITGGTVTAYGGSFEAPAVTGGGKRGGAGIGGGDSSRSGNIEITGGTVTAVGGDGAPGIGSGSDGSSSDSITISGPETVVKAKGSSEGASGIGGGRQAYSGKITITDGARVTASGGRRAIDGDVDADSLFDGNYIVLGGDQISGSSAAVAICYGGYTRSVRDLSSCRYLELEPITLNKIAVSPEEANVNIGQSVQLAVKVTDGSHKGIDLAQVLGAKWTLTATPANASRSVGTYIDENNNTLHVGGDEKADSLTAEGSFEELSGVEVTNRTSLIHVEKAAYRISFDPNGGALTCDPMITNMGLLTGDMPVPTRTGYTFAGWYTAAEGGEPITGSYVFSGNTTVYAHWNINRHIVTYHSMGGNPETFTREVNYGGIAPTPATPVQDLHVFQGWYTDLNYSRKWDFDRDRIYQNTDLYAKWADAVLDVTISADVLPEGAGRVLYTGSYRAGSGVTLEAESLGRYRFSHWLLNGEIVGTSPRIQLTADESKTLTAVFERIASSGGSGSSGGGGGSSGGGGGGGGGGSRQSAAAQIPAFSPVPSVSPGSGAAVSTVVNVATNGASSGIANASEVSGAWVQNAQGWSLQLGDGTVASNSWICVTENDGAHWYHFGGTGIMDTGWLNVDGKIYYLHAVSDGTAGRMMTGWQQLDGKWYYFSSAGDATLGTLLVNTTTPDGYYVNAQGEWIQ